MKPRMTVAIATFLLALTVQASGQDAEASKFCGDPGLAEDEPCLPPNWCEGPNGTYPGRPDGSCHPEDANGPPVRAAAPPPFVIACPEGYEAVMRQSGQQVCAGDLRLSE